MTRTAIVHHASTGSAHLVENSRALGDRRRATEHIETAAVLSTSLAPEA